MSEPATPARPRQLTMAGGFVIGGSIFLLLTVFDTFTTLQSVEMREEVSKVLSSPTGKGLGISVSEALSLMRVGLMVAAACAAATAVLGVYALQRQRAARLALSILAVPILLTAPLTGGLVGALVVAATVMLWSGPARDWFAGRPVREPVARAPREQQRPPTPQPPAGGPEARGEGPATTAATVSTAGTSTTPAATTGFGERPVQQESQPWDARGAQHQHQHQQSGVTAGPVPVTVKVACILTWIFSGVVALMYAGMMVALAVAQDDIVKYFTETPEWQRAGIERDMLVPLLWVGCLMFLGWALGACVLAWFAWRRHNWARWLLAFSAGAALVAALFAFPFGTLHQIAAALTIAGLFGSAARTWFAPAPWTPGPQPGQQGQQPGQQHDQHQGPQGPPPPGGKPPVW